MKYDVFSANPSISPTGLKPSDVRERGRIGETRSDCGEQDRTRGNGVGLGGTGSD